MLRYVSILIVSCLATACVAESYDSSEETARVAEGATLSSTPPDDDKEIAVDENRSAVGDLSIGKSEARTCSCDDVGNPQPGEVCDRCEPINGVCWCFYHLKNPTHSQD